MLRDRLPRPAPRPFDMPFSLSQGREHGCRPRTRHHFFSVTDRRIRGQRLWSGRVLGLDHRNPGLLLTAQSFQRSAAEYCVLTGVRVFSIRPFLRSYLLLSTKGGKRRRRLPRVL